MMDLTTKRLPNVIEINGSRYPINTDFRLWMRFEIEVGKLKPNEKLDVSYLFVNEMPLFMTLNDLLAFARPERILPRSTGSYGDAIAMDYEIDSELILAAFWGQYGIDLTEADLHWHTFLALLHGLNEQTKLREVMGYRMYEKNNGQKDHYEELKRAWTIEKLTMDEDNEILKFSQIFRG